tara:strand:- start:527 stop:1108 length:582 start_codon:yes stop_codon:yes gene_type:complete
MKEYEIDYGSFIGGWYMPEEICDSVVDVLISEKDKLVDGETGRGLTPELKKCKELYISPADFDVKLKEYLDCLSKCVDLYKERYPFCDQVGVYSLKDNNIKIQHYMPGDGFYKWHAENGGSGYSTFRHLVFMTYLNTLDSAGTEFYYQKTITPCEKGLTIIWPAGWTHTHRGVTNYESEKTIITGWYSFHEDQ